MTGDIDTIFSTMKSLLIENDLLNWLVPTRSNDVIRITWYRGDYWGNTFLANTSLDYKVNLSSMTNGFESDIGLIRVGEMLSSQSLSLLSKNYSVSTSYNNTKNYWSLTPYGSTGVWVINNSSLAGGKGVNESLSVRPVIMAKSNTKIIGGNGTMSNPFKI